MTPVVVNEKFNLFSEHWTPHIVGELNGQYVKLAKLKDHFVWHSHDDEDEMFLVFKGTLVMEFRDKIVEINPGEFIIVPKKTEHNPQSKNGEEVWIMLLEPKDILHTGNVEHTLTKKSLEWI